MKNQTTPMRTENSAKVIRLHLAIELSRKKWKLAFSDGRGGRARLRTVAGRDLQAVRGEIAQAKRHFGLADEVETVSCYEAGREGFWVHRALTAHGVVNVIVDAASIDVQRRKRAKTDRLDAESLVRKLVRYYAGKRRCGASCGCPVRNRKRRDSCTATWQYCNGNGNSTGCGFNRCCIPRALKSR